MSDQTVVINVNVTAPEGVKVKVNINRETATKSRIEMIATAISNITGYTIFQLKSKVSTPELSVMRSMYLKLIKTYCFLGFDETGENLEISGASTTTKIGALNNAMATDPILFETYQKIEAELNRIIDNNI